MARAVISTRSGATVTIEGTHDEVAALVARIEPGESVPAAQPATQRRARPKATPMSLISELAAGRFFSEPKELGSVKTALEEQGHFYPVTTLSPVMLRLVRKKVLRRIKDNNRWTYIDN